MEVICLKENGKIKLVDNQFDLNALNSKEYVHYLFPVDMYASIYKAFSPDTRWVKPIKKISVDYALKLFNESVLDQDSLYTPEVIDLGLNSNNVMHIEFTDIIDFITFMHSFENLTMYSLTKPQDIGSCVLMAYFEMEYTSLDGETTKFKLKKKHCKYTHDIFKGYGFSITTLFRALDEFMGHDITKRAVFNNISTLSKDIYLSPDLKRWDYKKHTDWLVSVSLLVCCCVTFIRADIIKYLDKMSYLGAFAVTEYDLTVSEDVLPFDTPITVDVVQMYSPQYFDIYDSNEMQLTSTNDIINSVMCAPTILKTYMDIRDLTGLPDCAIDHTIIQIKLYPYNEMTINDDGALPFKYIVYDTDLSVLQCDQVFKDFMDEFKFWINDPYAYNIDNIMDDGLPF